MTTRAPISAIQNGWFDAEQIDVDDLNVEQASANSYRTSLITNHIGSGVLPETLSQNVIFNSASHVGILDGVWLNAQNQPTDASYGNQLEISLQNSNVAGNKSVKVALVGLDFNGDLKYETFVFYKNETQITKKHFVKILGILVNDMLGSTTKSFNLGGDLVVKEAKRLVMSRDAIMASQNLQPNLFFRDFFTDNGDTLDALFAASIPYYNYDALDIRTSELIRLSIPKDDVVTQVGQKFKATTNNIQKITFLMSVVNKEEGSETDLSWTGDLIISVYPLQTDVNCITDIVPSLDIEFPPSNIPLAQLSVNYASLQSRGIVLDNTPQPVDFIFSNTPIANGTSIVPGKYYAVVVKRSGSANKCEIEFSAGEDLATDAELTTFTGNIWVNIPDQDLWFEVWSDAVKLTDGQVYEAGHGLEVPKTTIDQLTSDTVDYCLSNLYFTGTDTYQAIVQSSVEKSEQVQNQRTGNTVYSRQQEVPDIKLYTSLQLNALTKSSSPLSLGIVSDKNKKFTDLTNTSSTTYLHHYGVINNEIVIKIIDDPLDARYDIAVNSLVSSLLNGDLVGAKITPNTSSPSKYYRVADAELCSMMYGDVNGDGVIDNDDLTELNKLIGFDLNTSPPLNTSITTDNINTTYTNGYNSYVSSFSSSTGISFQVVNRITTAVVAMSTDGVLTADPNDPTIANFGSALVDFSSIIDLDNCDLVIQSASPSSNYGGFKIISLDTLNDVITVRKIILSGETLYRMLRSDIDADMIISNTDGYYLSSYLNKDSYATNFSTLPYSKIGTTFNVIKLKVEKFTDRADDYTSSLNRATDLHQQQNVLVLDASFQSKNFYSSPMEVLIEKQLVWYDRLISITSNPKLVPCIFTTDGGLPNKVCKNVGTTVDVYPVPDDFYEGTNDLFIPDDLIIGGTFKDKDGQDYKVDFEVGTVVLEIPEGLVGVEKTINVFDNFVADYGGNGLTRLGFPSMRFADCSLVSTSAVSNNQVRFSASLQAFSPNTNGLDDGYGGVIVDGKMGLYIDYATGLLTINFTNLYEDPIYQTLKTKIQVNVYLKKAGFNNTPIYINSDQVRNLLDI